MNTTMAESASERLDAQIADALFGQPGMSKLDVANRLRQLRGEGSPLLADAGNPVSPSSPGHGNAPWPEIDMILADAYSAGAEGLQFEGIARRTAVRAAVFALAARQPVGQLPHGIRFIEIPRRNNLDPINVFVQDYDPGRGRIVVTCYGQAWCGFWGAMGDRTVMKFVASCDAKYVATNMLSGGHGYTKKSERHYVERIAAEVIAEFRALIDSQAVGIG